jgi:hypothetical protein
LEVNDSGLAAVQSFRDTAKSKFEANQVPQQDVLQADVELAQLEQRRVEIDQARQVAMARINTLLHREPQLPLPMPPERLGPAGDVPDVDALRAQAVERRPELAALQARLNAEQNALKLACAEYYPDFEIMGKYDTFWTDPAQRGQVALNVNVPLYRGRRDAAVREAMFRVNKLQAEYEQQVDLIEQFPTAPTKRPRPEVFKVEDVSIAGVSHKAIAPSDPARVGWHFTVPDAVRADVDLVLVGCVGAAGVFAAPPAASGIPPSQLTCVSIDTWQESLYEPPLATSVPPESKILSIKSPPYIVSSSAPPSIESEPP